MKKKHFVLSGYSNEFEIRIFKVFGLLITINGFWFLRHYKNHYRHWHKEFKKAMLYERSVRYNYFILLQNLHYDLSQKKNDLESQHLKYSRGLKGMSLAERKSSLATKLRYWLQFYSTKRRISYCYWVQLRYISLSIMHCEALAKNAKVKLVSNSSLPDTDSNCELDMLWTGSKLEFLQWSYALFKSGRINDGKGELRKSVEALARFLNVKIEKSNYSDLSKSIHHFNDDYFPQIFEDLSKSYLQYITIQKQKRAE